MEFAPAKVNLTLAVGAARADGYHPLHSIVAFADWGDEIAAEPADALTLSLEGGAAAPLRDDPQNLVLKAAFALRAAAERPELGAALRLRKRLPVAAGLGGGSADAAAALRLLNQLWDIGFSTRQLSEIGTIVGADVPACVYSRPLLMTGIGEVVTPLIAWPALPAVIVNPGVPVSTAAVFKAFDQGEAEPLPATRPPVAGDVASALSALAAGRNDLEPPAQALEPAISTVLKGLAAAPGARLTRMSGSGASCFALFQTQDAAAEAGAQLAAQNPDWIVKAVTLQAAV